jgi:hypothetical protein
MTEQELVEDIARAMWERRRKFSGNFSIQLEEWGDGSIPKANGIIDEANAALKVVYEKLFCGVLER